MIHAAVMGYGTIGSGVAEILDTASRLRRQPVRRLL